jgi:predicted lipoprotein with Yx(FWY)xxD motif
MKKRLFASSVVLLMAAGCNSTQQVYVPSATTTPTQDQAPMATTTPPAMDMATSTTPMMAGMTTVINLGTSSSLGQYLTASNGMTLYTYNNDTANTSNCSGSCATNWPPYTVQAGLNLAAVSGVSGKMGTISRADGSIQVTYNGMPLYFWANDVKSGDTTGQGVSGFTVAKP